MNDLHAHVQMYTSECESLLGFDPNNVEDVVMCHKMLDEYLGALSKFMASLPPKTKEAKEWDADDAGFHIWPTVDRE